MLPAFNHLHAVCWSRLLSFCLWEDAHVGFKQASRAIYAPTKHWLKGLINTTTH